MRSCNTERSAFLGRSSELCEQGNESGGVGVRLGGGSVWGLSFLALCVTKGLKIETKQRQ